MFAEEFGNFPRAVITLRGISMNPNKLSTSLYEYFSLNC